MYANVTGTTKVCEQLGSEFCRRAADGRCYDTCPEGTMQVQSSQVCERCSEKEG